MHDIHIEIKEVIICHLFACIFSCLSVGFLQKNVQFREYLLLFLKFWYVCIEFFAPNQKLIFIKSRIHFDFVLLPCIFYTALFWLCVLVNRGTVKHKSYQSYLNIQLLCGHTNYYFYDDKNTFIVDWTHILDWTIN